MMMSNPENEQCSSFSAESDMSDVSKRSSPTLCEEHLPKCSSDWNCHLVNKLCVRYKQVDIIRIIWSEWRLFHLDEDDRLEVERCVDACDLKLNYKSLQDIAPNTTTPIEEFAKTWGPSRRQLRLIQAEPLLDKFLFKLDEFNYCLAQIVAENEPNMEISEWKYQCLFEKLLHLFGIYTWSPPFISTKKSQIIGRSMTSKADLLCCSSDPAVQRPIVCVCEVKKTLPEKVCQPPTKKLRNSSSVDTAITYIVNNNSWSQHIGDLFVYLDKSSVNEGILGISVKTTWVKVTFLKVKDPCLEKIRNMPVNSLGSVKLDDDEHPIFYYSECYNFLKQSDRKILFKALLTIRLMQGRFEAGRGSTR